MKQCGFLAFVSMAWLMLPMEMFAATVEVSGGGTNLIRDAIDAAASGDTVLITDSAVYTEDYQYYPFSKENLTVMAAVGQSPEINFTSATDHSSAWSPNAAGIKIGDNDGGQITFRKKRSPGAISYAIASMWYPANQELIVENCKFTSTGTGGPWDGAAIFAAVDSSRTVTVTLDNCEFLDFRDNGEPVILGPPWQPSVNLNIRNSRFEQTDPATQLPAIIGSQGSYTVNLSLSNCYFRNYSQFVTFNAGSLSASDCYFLSPTGPGILLNESANSKSVELSNCAFYEAPTGVHQIYVLSAGPATMTVDHCDFFSSQADAPAITVDNLTNAQISVTNSQFGTAPMLWSFSAGGSFSGTWQNCNMFGTGISAAWTDGGSNVSPAETPDYSDIPSDWRYTNATLLTADQLGGPVGSRLNWLVPSAPISAARTWMLLN